MLCNGMQLEKFLSCRAEILALTALSYLRGLDSGT